MRVSGVILALGNMTLPQCNKSHHYTLQQSIFVYYNTPGWKHWSKKPVLPSVIMAIFYRAWTIFLWQIRPSVYPSHSGIISRQLHISSNSFHHMLGEWF